MMKTAVIIPAAGKGLRFGEKNKLEQAVAGRPVLIRSIELFSNRKDVEQVIVAVNPDALDEFRFKWNDQLQFMGVQVVAGGRQERWETVLKALEAVKEDITHIAVHDAARPLATRRLIDRMFEAARQFSAVIPGVPVNSTLKRAEETTIGNQPDDPFDAILGGAGQPQTMARCVKATVDRQQLYEVQTPQIFAHDLLDRAYAQIKNQQVGTDTVTDDAGLIECLGERVYLMEGESTNLKITRSEDLPLMEAIYQVLHKDAAVQDAKKRLFVDDDDE